MRYFVDVDGESVIVNVEPGRVQLNDESIVAELADVPGTPVFHLAVGNAVFSIVVTPGNARGEYTVWTDEHRLEVEVLDERSRAIRDMTRTSAARSGPASLVAPMPGLIVRLAVQVGETVTAGQSLVVMEAMKMENELRAATPGTVKSIQVEVGAAVEKGVLLVEME